jgi:hypothetical protein
VKKQNPAIANRNSTINRLYTQRAVLSTNLAP